MAAPNMTIELNLCNPRHDRFNTWVVPFVTKSRRRENAGQMHAGNGGAGGAWAQFTSTDLQARERRLQVGRVGVMRRRDSV